MTKDGGRRIATPTGAMLADPACVGTLLDTAAPLDAAAEALFEPQFWAARGELKAVGQGRGAAWFLNSGPGNSGPGQWVLRHYRRGGFMARILKDRYLWAGEARVRAFAEYRLLAVLVQRGLPVPKPVAARYQRSGMSYRCDLIMQRIADAKPVSSMLGAAALSDASWRAIGSTLARLHQNGVDHADLNAHNILIDGQGAVSVIDFDRGRVRARGAWTSENLSRLHRSLVKVSRPLPSDRFSPESWKCLLAGYESFGS
jgi:3-deoxy-D-manno-octulosonic acid kinase